MRVKSIEDENFTNYKEASMTIGTISCNGKCCHDAGIPLTVCLNDRWRRASIIDMEDEKIVERYLSNPMTSAIVFAGLEPFEQFFEMLELIRAFRRKCNDPIIIYTGYRKDEIEMYIEGLSNFPNIIVKFGRFVPGGKPRYDEVLGVTLVSENQYAERIS